MRRIGINDLRNEFLFLQDAHDLLKGFKLVLRLIEHGKNYHAYRNQLIRVLHVVPHDWLGERCNQQLSGIGVLIIGMGNCNVYPAERKTGRIILLSSQEVFFIRLLDFSLSEQMGGSKM